MYCGLKEKHEVKAKAFLVMKCISFIIGTSQKIKQSRGVTAKLRFTSSATSLTSAGSLPLFSFTILALHFTQRVLIGVCNQSAARAICKHCFPNVLAILWCQPLTNCAAPGEVEHTSRNHFGSSFSETSSVALPTTDKSQHFTTSGYYMGLYIQCDTHICSEGWEGVIN